MSPNQSQVFSDRDAFQKLGLALSERHAGQLSAQLAVFQSALVNFAQDHGDAIKNNPEFKHKFVQMCERIGIDSMELLVFVESKARKSDGYLVGLGVRIVEICQETRNLNGGLISVKELHSRLLESDSVPLDVPEADVKKALASLATLGSGYGVLTINNKQWVKFVGLSGLEAISNDHKRVYELCEFTGGFVTHRLLRDNYGWDVVRSKSVLDELIMNGFLWIDTQGCGEPQYWEPSWISK